MIIVAAVNMNGSKISIFSPFALVNPVIIRYNRPKTEDRRPKTEFNHFFKGSFSFFDVLVPVRGAALFQIADHKTWSLSINNVFMTFLQMISTVFAPCCRRMKHIGAEPALPSL
jgi:hypothetical protein